MPMHRYKPEQIVSVLRQVEVAVASGKTTPQACKEAGITVQLRDECLNGEIFYSLKEAQVVVEQWRQQYNTRRPHSALGYRPPAPGAYSPVEKPVSRPQIVV